MKRRWFGVMAAGFGLVGCIPETSGHDWGDAGQDALVWRDARTGQDARPDGSWVPPTNSRVYVNTRTSLYYIDPGESEELVKVGDFQGPCTEDEGFFDIALDERKRMIGISAQGLYWVDIETAECTRAYQFPPDSPRFYSLSFVKGVFPENPEQDVLVAASAEDGEWVAILFQDEMPGKLFLHLGYYDPNFYKWRSSGDIVSFEVGWNQFKTYATIRCESYDEPGCEGDWLAEVNPPDGYARPLGKVVDANDGHPYQEIYGLGFWGDRLYGFTENGEYIRIDPNTAKATLLQEFGQPFWGAGNTTKPYVVQ